MSPWNEARFQLERFTELGMAIRRRRSSEGGRAVLWIHGLGESGLCFEPVICDPRLSDHHHLVPDLIGYGKSTWPEQPLSLEQHAASLDLLLDRLGLERVTLVGHSMGGVIGLYLSSRHRRRVERFVNVEGNISPADCTSSRSASAHSLEEWLDHGYDDFLDQLHARGAPAARSPARPKGATIGGTVESEGEEPGDAAETTEAPAVLRAYSASIHMADPRAFHRNSLELVRESDREDLAERQGTLEAPQLYVHGRPRGTGARSLELLEAAGIPTAAFEPAGHWPFLDQHEAFVELLSELLSHRA
ncbi:MAG: alpha/beta hydrolase [Holophagales bacterium]|nr:alpha/beta hydrolase [Holophagales bacterium]